MRIETFIQHCIPDFQTSDNPVTYSSQTFVMFRIHDDTQLYGVVDRLLYSLNLSQMRSRSGLQSVAEEFVTRHEISRRDDVVIEITSSLRHSLFTLNKALSHKSAHKHKLLELFDSFQKNPTKRNARLTQSFYISFRGALLSSTVYVLELAFSRVNKIHWREVVRASAKGSRCNVSCECQCRGQCKVD